MIAKHLILLSSVIALMNQGCNKDKDADSADSLYSEESDEEMRAWTSDSTLPADDAAVGTASDIEEVGEPGDFSTRGAGEGAGGTGGTPQSTPDPAQGAGGTMGSGGRAGSGGTAAESTPDSAQGAGGTMGSGGRAGSGGSMGSGGKIATGGQ